MQIETPRLILREYRLSDFPAVRRYNADPEIQFYENGPLNDEQSHLALLRAHMWSHADPRHNYRLAVTVRPSDEVAGRISLSSQNNSIREWEIGWLMDRSRWGHGYATEAACGLLKFAFEELNAHRVVAFCHAQNKASQRVMEKIGMHPEGLLRATRWWHNGWSDELVYAILEGEWKP